MKLTQARLCFLTWIVVITFSPPQVTGSIVLCDGCRPREMKDAPGVGIDLTMAYAEGMTDSKFIARTAAIHYKNGTTRDLGKFDGKQEYLLAMKTLAEDAQNVRNGIKSSMGRLDSSSPILQPVNSHWLSPYLGIFAPKMRPAYEDQSRLRDTEDLGDDLVKAIAAMLSDVKSGAMDLLDPPLKYNHVFLSWPDFEYEFTHTDRIHLASSLAGLEDFDGGTIASRLALSQEGVSEACYDPEKDMEDMLCDPSLPNLSTMLVVSYNTASLGITLNTRLWGDIPWPERLMEIPTLGASFANATSLEDSAQYWTKVRESIASVIGNTTIDYLLLLGSYARDPNLLGAIKDVIESCGNIDPSILDRYTASPSSPNDQASALFAAARRAAVNARVGMETGFKACDEPPWCETQSEQQCLVVRFIKSYFRPSY